MSNKFPNRPSHDDYRIMSKSIHKLEAMNLQENVERISQEFAGVSIDMKSLQYMAFNRAGIAAQTFGLAENTATLAFISAVWFEGFLMGIRFAEEKRKEGEGSV